MSLAITSLTLARGGRTLLKEVSATCAPGSVTVLAGPNGAGKSTILLALAGELPPAGGDCIFSGSALHRLSPTARAKSRALLPQASVMAFDFTVREVVAMGLHPHALSPHHGRGTMLVDAAIADFDLNAMADRPVTRLSGGEQQRVHLARTFVQLRGAEGPALLLLDEPMNGLDYRHQFALARLIRAEATRGATIILSLHDLAMAERVADQILLLDDCRLIAAGPPARILHAAQIAATFGLDEEEALALLAPQMPMAQAAE